MLYNIAFALVSILILITPSINAYVTKYEFRREVLILNVLFIAACEYIGSVVTIPVLGLEGLTFLTLYLYSSER